MEIKAQAKYIRVSSKKVRLVLDLIKGLDVLEAQGQLKFLSKQAKQPVLKVLNSAIANAENNFKLKKENLYIKNALADQGPTLKRWMPKAFGRATPIRKRSAHITIFLEERVKTKAPVVKESSKKKIEKLERMKVLPKEIKTREELVSQPGVPISKLSQEEKPEIFDERRKGKSRSKQHLDKIALKDGRGFMKKIFRRKAG